MTSRAVSTDVADDDSIRALVEQAASVGLDIAVNNAGATHHPTFHYGVGSWRNADLTALADDIRGFDDPSTRRGYPKPRGSSRHRCRLTGSPHIRGEPRRRWDLVR